MTTFTYDLADRMFNAHVGTTTETRTYNGEGMKLVVPHIEATTTIATVDFFRRSGPLFPAAKVTFEGPTATFRNRPAKSCSPVRAEG